MKRTLVVALAVLLGAVFMLLLFRDPIKQAAYDRLTRDMFVAGDSDDFDPGPAVGSHFPGLNAAPSPSSPPHSRSDTPHLAILTTTTTMEISPIHYL